MQTRQQQRKEARQFVALQAGADRRKVIREREIALSVRRAKRRHLSKRRSPAQQAEADRVAELNAARKKRCKQRGYPNRSHIVTTGGGWAYHATKGWKRVPIF